MKELIYKLLALILYPLLHVRMFWVIPLAAIAIFTDAPLKGNLLTMPILFSIIGMGFIYGNCQLLGPILNLFIKLFKIDYTYEGDWTEDMLHSHSVWTHPIYKVKLDNGENIEIKPSFAKMGGNIYEPETKEKRIVLFTYLWNNK